MELIANELSLAPPAADVGQAFERMQGLVQLMAIGRVRYGIEALYTPRSFLQTQIAPGCSIVQWCNDGRIDIEAQRLLMSLSSKGPFIEDQLLPDRLTEARVGGTLSIGLEFAYAASRLAISMPVQPWIDSPTVAVDITEADEFADLQTHTYNLPHVAIPEHWETHRDWLDQQYRVTIESGTQLWAQRTILFPHLQFCGTAGEQLIDCSLPALKGALKMLTALNNYAMQLANEEHFDKTLINCDVSGESQTTLDQYSEPRTVTCPDGQRRLFEWHAKHHYSNWRVHFIPTPRSNPSILIGYIGKHLPTARTPH